MPESKQYDNSPFHYEAIFREELVIIPANTTLEKGTILGEIFANGKLTKFDKTKTDGSQIPVAILNKSLINTDTANTIEITLPVIILGKINENKLPAETKVALNDIVANQGKVKTILKNNGLLVLSSQELMK